MVSTDQSQGARARELDRAVWTALEQGDVRRAAARCDRLNRELPTFVPGWYTASHVALRLNKPAMAVTAIRRARAGDPDNVRYRLQEAVCLAASDQRRELVGAVDGLVNCEFDTAAQHTTMGTLLTRVDRQAEAAWHYTRACELAPNEGRHFYNLACVQRSLGELNAAETNFDRAIALDPEDAESYKIRADVRTQTPERNHIEELERRLEQTRDPRARVQLLYALAKEREDLGHFAESFACLESGAATRRGYMQYDVNHDLSTMEAIRQVYNAAFFAEARPGCETEEPVFVLGMPRTGTTLVERILASHPSVHSAGELMNFAVAMTAAVASEAPRKPTSRPDMVALSAQIDFRQLGERYLDSTRPTTGHAARFIDKMPLNFLYVGLIATALPNARIIRLERHPVDTCFSVFKQLFVDAYPFSYDLDELARYYVGYRTLMTHWETVLPGRIHTVRYESLVADVESEARAALAWCGLDWDPACLSFHENRTAATTASAVQVRQPVYDRSVGRWRKNERELKPLIDHLATSGISIEPG